MSRVEAKRKKTSASTWRKKDREYRERERARRQANALRRQEFNEATARGISVEAWRKEKAEADE